MEKHSQTIQRMLKNYPASVEGPKALEKIRNLKEVASVDPDAGIITLTTGEEIRFIYRDLETMATPLADHPEMGLHGGEPIGNT